MRISDWSSDVCSSDLTKAMVKAAEELNAPVICQTSAKTIKYYSHKEIVSWVRTVAEDSSVPVVLHLDHFKDIPMIDRKSVVAGKSVSVRVGFGALRILKNKILTQTIKLSYTIQ